MLDANQYRAAAQNLGIDILDKGYNTNFIKEMQQTGYTQIIACHSPMVMMIQTTVLLLVL